MPSRATVFVDIPFKLLAKFLLVICLCFAASGYVAAQQEKVHKFNIPKQPIRDALELLATQAGVSLLFPYDQVARIEGNAVSGHYTLSDAVDILLKDTELKGSVTKSGVLTVSLSPTQKVVGKSLLQRLLTRKTEKSAADTDPAELQKNYIEEILVTAQKRRENLQEVPISVVAIGGSTIEKVNADSLDDIARLVPSLSITDFQRGSNNIQIRGLGSNVSNVGTVAIYNDGIISFSRVQSNGIFAEQDATLYDIERIEVLRGPQGTLYGEGSFGGVVNIISRQPDYEHAQASISLSRFNVREGSSHNTDLAGMINLPLIQDKLAIRLVGFNNDHDGFIEGYNISPALDPLDPMPPILLGKDLNTEKTSGGRVMLGYTNDTMEGSLIYKWEKLELGINKYTSARFVGALDRMTGSTIGDISFTFPLFRDEFGATQKTQEIILKMSGNFEFWTLTSITGYGEIDAEDNAFRSITRGWSEELRLHSNSDASLNWVLGAFFRHVEKNEELIINSSPFRLDRINQWSLFGQLYWEITDSITATFGVRYSQQDSLVNEFINVESLGPLSRVKATFKDTSPKIALDWQIDQHHLAYASISKGFRAGGVSTDFSLGRDPNYVRSFDPDEIWNYEVGLKSSFAENRAIFNIALFYIDWNDVQIDRPIEDNIIASDTSIDELLSEFIPVNGKGAHSLGVEADLFLRPAKGWNINFGGSWVEAEFDGGEIISPYIDAEHPQGVYPIDGMKLPNSPEYLINATVEKTVPLVDRINAYLRIDYTLRGRSFADVPNNPNVADFKTSRFELINLYTGLRGEAWEIQAFIKNLDDKHASTMDWFDGTFDFRASIIPRTIGINLKYRFN